MKLTQSTLLIVLLIRGTIYFSCQKEKKKLSFLMKVEKLWGEEANPVAELLRLASPLQETTPDSVDLST